MNTGHEPDCPEDHGDEPPIAENTAAGALIATILNAVAAARRRR